MQNSSEKHVSTGGSNTLLPAVGSSLKVGDVLRIKDNREYNSLGIVDFPVIDVDGHSFAVKDDLGLKWWFYKDKLTPYAGDADILGVVPQ
jgi:hypothetical protein